MLNRPQSGVILWQTLRQSQRIVGKAQLLYPLMRTANNQHCWQPVDALLISRTIQIQYTMQRIINPLPKFATLQQLTTSPLKQTFQKLSHCWQLSGLVHDAVDNMNRPRQTGAVQQGVVGGGKWGYIILYIVHLHILRHSDKGICLI